jgi:hypothetical protein
MNCQTSLICFIDAAEYMRIILKIILIGYKNFKCESGIEPTLVFFSTQL